MKKNLLIIAIMAASFSAGYSQKLTPEEKATEKEWAKKMKELKPLDYKKLVEEKDALAAEVSHCENSKVTIKDDLVKKDEEIARLKKELEDYNTGAVPGIAAGGNKPAESTTHTATETSTTHHESKSVAGVIYKVQIGSFKNKDLSKYFENNKNFSGDVDPDGTKKYTLGSFTDYWEADTFKKYLREMGVKDAWIVPYKDGHRVALKEVLDGGQ